MKRLEIICTAAPPQEFFSELDFEIYQQKINHWQIKNNTIQIYSSNPDFISSMAGTVDWVKRQTWFDKIKFQCITQEEYIQEKI